MKPAVLLSIYAAVLGAAGLTAFLLAPPESSRITALIIPGAAAALAVAVAAFAARNSARGRNAGIGLTVVLALLFVIPAWSRTKAWLNHPAAVEAWSAAVAAGQATEGDPAAKRAFFRERGAAPHDIRYLVVTLWGLAGASVLTGTLLLAGGLERSGRTSAPESPVG